MNKNNLSIILLGFGLFLFYDTESAALTPEQCAAFTQGVIDVSKQCVASSFKCQPPDQHRGCSRGFHQKAQRPEITVVLVERGLYAQSMIATAIDAAMKEAMGVRAGRVWRGRSAG